MRHFTGKLNPFARGMPMGLKLLEIGRWPIRSLDARDADRIRTGIPYIQLVNTGSVLLIDNVPFAIRRPDDQSPRITGELDGARRVSAIGPHCNSLVAASHLRWR